MAGLISDIFLKTFDYIKSSLKTSQAKRNAIFDKNSRVFSEGKVINLQETKSSIKIGKFARIRGEILCFPHGGNIAVGDWFYIGPNSLIWSSDKKGIIIGDRVLVSSDVSIFDNNSHPLDKEERFKQTQEIFNKGHPKNIKTIESAPIIIEDDVWICRGATIMKGIHIGKGAIIGTNAIILSDVSDGSIILPGVIHKKDLN